LLFPGSVYPLHQIAPVSPTSFPFSPTVVLLKRKVRSPYVLKILAFEGI
jgi:hypothetical protein